MHLSVITSWVYVRPCPCVKQAHNLFLAKGSAVARKEVMVSIAKTVDGQAARDNGTNE